MRKFALPFFCGLFALAFGCSSCSSVQSMYASVDKDARFYQSVQGYLVAPDDVFLEDISNEQNVNGTYPDHILIKTMTQTFTRDYEFMIRGGKLFYKPKTESLWSLYCGTGLPKGASSVVEISADSNCVFVFDDRGRLFRTYTDKEVRKSAASPSYIKPFTWVYTYGWPESVVFHQGVMARNKRAWAMGARRKDMLYYEDIFSNQHHYGTMGLETVYFLSESGQEIRFTDSGLPADLSKSILTPEKGRFIAVNLGNAASTSFIIGAKGTMYTRLIDFDTMGCDPMFFKYTYIPYISKYKGSDYLSNYEPWGLPAEGWRRQSDINLEGKARLTKFISIHQNGQGNSARELRVAGLDKDGESGYYSKQIFDEEWSFTKANLSFRDSDFLSGGDEWGESAEYNFKGNVFKDGSLVEGLSVSTGDFTLANEGSFTLLFTMAKDGWSESKSIPFYDVEMWTYMTRVDPGKDGMPKNFFVTPDFSDDKALECAHDDFTSLLSGMFKGLGRKTFCITSEASSQYLELSWKNSRTSFTSERYVVFLDKNGAEGDPDALKGAYMYENPLLKAYSSPELCVERELYTRNDIPLLEQAVAANNDYIKILKGQMITYSGYSHDTNMSRWEWNLADLVLTVTFLNQIDFPKIKTVSMHAGEIFKQNAGTYIGSYAYMSMAYPHIISLASLRIRKYNALLSSLQENETAISEDWFKDDCASYFDSVGFPEEFSGIASSCGKKAAVYRVNEISLYPGLLICDFTDSGEVNQYVIAELSDFEEKAADYIEKNKRKLVCDVNFYVTASGSGVLGSALGVRGLEKKKGKMTFENGSLKIKAGLRTVFETQTE